MRKKSSVRVKKGTVIERFRELGLVPAAFAGSLAVSFLLYDSLWGLFSFIPVWYFLRRWYCSRKREKLRRQMSEDFLVFLGILKGELLAGLSVENAFWTACEQLKVEKGEKTPLCRSLSEMKRQNALNIPVEELFWKFSKITDLEEICDFAEIFRYAKRSGGDLRKIIDGSVRKIRERYETENELMILVAGRRFEQRVLSCIPVLLLLYMRVANPDYMSVLYGNLNGILFMTGCGIVYMFCLYAADQILRIQF